MENNANTQWWTTLEEAQALIQAGLDPNTADMHIIHLDNGTSGCLDTGLGYSKWDSTHEEGYLPCWSFGALLALMPWRIRIANIAGMEYYLRVGKAENEFWVNYESEIADLPGTYIGFNTCIDKCSPTACAVKLVQELLNDGHIEKHKETE